MIHQLTVMREELLYAIFLYLHKAYDSLDRYICLKILERYSVGPWAYCILCKYWDRLQMVARVAGRYGQFLKFSGG